MMPATLRTMNFFRGAAPGLVTLTIDVMRFGLGLGHVRGSGVSAATGDLGFEAIRSYLDRGLDGPS